MCRAVRWVAVFVVMALVPAAAAGMDGGAESPALSGHFAVIPGYETFDSNVEFAPMPQIFTSLSQKHGVDFPWESSTATVSFNAINLNGDPMFEDGTGLQPREMSLTLRGIGQDGCTDLELGLLEAVLFGNGSQSWAEKAHGFSVPMLAEDIPFEIGLQPFSMTGAGLEHRFRCGTGGAFTAEIEGFYKAPDVLRKVWGQHTTLVDGLPADSDTPSFRVAARNAHALTDNTSLRYGVNVVRLQDGERDGRSVTPAQTSYTGHIVAEHKRAGGTSLKLFLESGYIRNGSSHMLVGGSTNITGSYYDATVLGQVPLSEDVAFTFSGYGVKMPTDNNFFGKHMAGGEVGVEWTVYNQDNIRLGLAAKKGRYRVWQGPRDGTHGSGQILLRLDKSL